MMFLRRAGAAAACALAGIIGVAAPAGAAPNSYPYTVNQHDLSYRVADPGLCDTGLADISFTGVNRVIHVSATEVGLTDEEVRALYETGDPDGIATRFTVTETGKFTLEEPDGTTYTGTFTSRVGGNFNGHTGVLTGTYSVRGLSEAGDRIIASYVSHSTVANGEIVSELNRERVRGCPGG